LVAETRLSVEDLVWPVFVQPPGVASEPIASLPGVKRLSYRDLEQAVAEAIELGLPAMALFPVTPTALKTDDGREALNPDNIVCQTLKRLRDRFGDQIGLICDVALDPYTSHGQDGLVANGQVLNDPTLEVLAKQATLLAQAGASVVAPSDMMDGRVLAIRQALDHSGYPQLPILAYTAKYASAFYGPFRAAVGSAQQLGAADKKTYQMDPANGQEALLELQLDVAEGADMVMVKPGLPYLDIVWRLSQQAAVPVAAYQVSGEYAMLMAAVQHGWLDERSAVTESLVAFKRAGASCVLTYFALQLAGWLRTAD
jgi:porphobilinogen synthase